MTEPLNDVTEVFEGHVHDDAELVFPEWVSWFLYGVAAGIIVVSVVSYWKASKYDKKRLDVYDAFANAARQHDLAKHHEKAQGSEDKPDADDATAVQTVS
jgi:hypothetical protein